MKKFMRSGAAGRPPHPHLHRNGHANGAGVRRDDAASPLSRYWSGEECEEGEEGAAACNGGGGGGGALFEDAEFSATWRSLGDKSLAAGVRWLRPHELCPRPRYRGDERVGREEPGDTQQPAGEPSRWALEAGGPLAAGGAGVCAAAAALAGTPRLLDRALPPHSFSSGYSGAFSFRFWEWGEWREVRVDDRLPVRGSRLLGASSQRADDFTLPLLHKAYAKLYGGYGKLRAASGAGPARALQDLSGAIVQSFALRQQSPSLTFQVLNLAVPRSTLLVATATAGARAGQTCCVAGLARVRDGGVLVLLHAPAGASLGTAAWGPHGDKWRALAPSDRAMLAERAARPGHFWMALAEFVAAFDALQLVHVGPDDWLREPALQARRPWRAVLARRRWRYGYNAGGPPSAPTAHTNPQFHVEVGAAGAGEARCHVLVAVAQQYAARGAGRLRAVGFSVYEAREGARGLRPLDAAAEARTREVASLFALPAGRYLVVPHARAHQDGAFLLRILTDEPADVWELNDDNMVLHGPGAPAPPPSAEVRAAAARLLRDLPSNEVEAGALRAVLRRVWRACLCAAPSLELCRALVALRDTRLAGSLRAAELPALLAQLAQWRAAFLRFAARRCAGGPRASSYSLRALLRAGGVAASNKVLEGLVLRFARRAALSEEAYVMALARLHLAHERYRNLDTKMKSNPLSLEEMILMTIYS